MYVPIYKYSMCTDVDRYKQYARQIVRWNMHEDICEIPKRNHFTNYVLSIK